MVRLMLLDTAHGCQEISSENMSVEEIMDRELGANFVTRVIPLSFGDGGLALCFKEDGEEKNVPATVLMSAGQAKDIVYGPAIVVKYKADEVGNVKYHNLSDHEIKSVARFVLSSISAGVSYA